MLVTRIRSSVFWGLSLVWLVLGHVGSVSAQAPLEHRVFVSLSGGLEIASTTFTENPPFRLFVEDSDFLAHYSRDGDWGFDVTVGTRVWRNVAIGVGVSIFDVGSDATVTARLAHPFYFDRHREVSGAASGLARREIAIHLQPTWIVPVTDRIDVSVFGGPSFFRVDHDLITAVEFAHAYPFDTARFTGVATEIQSEPAIGFNAGVDVAFHFSANVGVGGIARFSRATVNFTSVDGAVVPTDAGGVQIGVGLRLRF